MKKATTKGAIRRSRATRLAQFPKKHLILVSGLAAITLGIMTLLPSEQVEAKRSELPLIIDAHKIPDTQQAIEDVLIAKDNHHTSKTPLDAVVADLDSELGTWKTVTIKSGDTLSALFNKQGLDAGVVYGIANTPEFGKTLSRIRPGETLDFRISKAGELTQFRYIQSKLKSIFFNKTNNGYQGELIQLKPQTRVTFSNGKIESSLFLASQKAGLSTNLTMELAGIFGWDIDFVQDIRTGDHFNLIYEEKFLDDQKLEDGNILAASFTNQGTTYTAIRYTDSKGETGYYSPDGKSMKKAFLRTPVEFTRISSRFNPNRLHPVFKTKRPHRGVDYAAPTNTPIKASGDGRIQFAGWQRGYGNVVYIQHPNNIVTVYAHQNKLRRGLKKGQRVRQGQVIGYVGKTGWATGPHLHYEFRLNGVHRNPMTVKLPDASPIPKREMARFQSHSQRLLAQLEKSQDTLLASN
ncbi:peptidoglycan DD-metalloendopeptidase family protein [Endozoicomonas sp. Mp262]|uniref:OapA family protein n=1 Tax=Endozoicomonas sp. Mp262 TaxID=2919499 RepID=UPI0021D8A09F